MYRKKTVLNYNIIFLLIVLCCISCLAIYSAQKTGQYKENFVLQQLIWYGVGTGIIILVMRIDTEQLYRLTWFLYGLNLFILIALVVSPEAIAPTRNGAKSWFVLPGLGSIQPSEFMKMTLIFTLSRINVVHNEKFRVRTIESDIKLLLKLTVFTIIPIGLIMLQPDMGTSLVLIAIFLGLVFISGISWKILTAVFGTVGAIFGTAFYMVLYHAEILKDYFGVQPHQFNRIYSWINPEEYASSLSYNYMRTITAIGSGTVSGKGFGQGVVYVPEKHSDFIFGAIGEDYGFIGSSIVISVFMLLIYSIVSIVLRSKDDFSKYICTGVIAYIVFHTFQNIGMDIGLLPITGIPLPFISY
ncbi:FtsW/RodA/SpoVE family cell cycle protein, partial [Priestia megaterium]